MGALLGEPLELVRCETSDVLVPAHAEMVIEAEILPDERVPEGPFGEFTGYSLGQRDRARSSRSRRSPIAQGPSSTISRLPILITCSSRRFPWKPISSGPCGPWCPP